MRALALLLVLLGHCCVSNAAPAARSDDCKLCRDSHRACVKNHSQNACKTEYDICMKHCRRS